MYRIPILMLLVYIFGSNGAFACSADSEERIRDAYAREQWQETIKLVHDVLNRYKETRDSDEQWHCQSLLGYEYTSWARLGNSEQTYLAWDRRLMLMRNLRPQKNREISLLANEFAKWSRSFSLELIAYKSQILKFASENSARAGEEFPGTDIELLARFYEGATLLTIGQLSDAVPILKSVVKMQLQSRVLTFDDELALFRTVVLTFNHHGNNAEAVHYQLLLLKEMERAGHDKSAEYVQETYAVASLMQMTANYADSVEYSAKALALYRTLGLKDAQLYRWVIDTHVKSLSRVGREQEASIYAQELLKAQGKRAPVLDFDGVRSRIGELLSMGDSAAAARLVQERIKSGKVAPDSEEMNYYLDWYANGSLLGSGEFSREQAARRLIAVGTAQGAGGMLQASRAYYDLALALEERKAYVEALAALNKSVSLQSGRIATDSVGDIRGRLLLALARPQEGLQAMAGALTYSRNTFGATHQATIELARKLAVLYAAHGQLDMARATGEEAVAGLDALFSERRYMPISDMRHMFARYDSVLKSYVEILLQSGLRRDAFLFIERTKARTATLQAIRAVSLRKEASKPGWLEAIDAANLRLTAADKAMAVAQTAAASQAATDMRIEAATTLRRLHTVFSTEHPGVSRLEKVPEIGAGGLAFLPAGTMYLSFYRFSDTQYGAMILDSKGTLSYHAVSPDFLLERSAESFAALPRGLGGLRLVNGMNTPLQVAKLTSGGRPVWGLQPLTGPCVKSVEPACGRSAELAAQYARQIEELAEAFGTALVAPIWMRIKEAKHLIISNEAGLALIPWDLVNYQGKKMVDYFSLSYAPNLWTVYEVQRRLTTPAVNAGQRRPLLAFGNPDYKRPIKEALLSCTAARDQAAQDLLEAGRGAQSALNFDWYALRFSHCELSGAIAAVGAGSSDLIERRNASEQNLRTLSKSGRLAQYDTLLFSSHGQFNPAAPLMSGLVLQSSEGGQEADNDGMFTIGDWAELRLSSRLVVLSGCSTARGEVVPGDGIMSMPTALLAAGNANTIGSLWSIDDERSAAFIQQFFIHYRQSKSASQALWQTKRQFRSSSNAAERNPSVWAAFVLFGI